VRSVAKSIREISPAGNEWRCYSIPRARDSHRGRSATLTISKSVIGKLYRQGQKGTVQDRVDVNTRTWSEDISVGSIVIVDNGLLRMEAIEKRENELICKVLTPGPMAAAATSIFPASDVEASCVDGKDYADI